MPPRLALVGCAAFVYALLRMERKESREVTCYLWVPTLWFLLTFSRPLGLWLGTSGETIEEGSASDRALLLALFFVALTVTTKRQCAWPTSIHGFNWLIIFLSFSLLSTVWSDTPFISFKRWFTTAIAVFMILSINCEPEPRAAAKVLLCRVVYICVPLSYVLIHYFPDYGKIYVHNEGVEMWTGVSLHKNSLSQLCLVAIVFLAWKITTDWKRRGKTGFPKLRLYGDMAVLLLAFWISLGPVRSITYSATATIATACSLGVFCLLLWKRRKRALPSLPLFTCVCLVVICYGTLTPFLGKLTVVDVSAAVGRNSSLTGRTEAWAAMVPAAMKHPVLGYGYGGFWTTERRDSYSMSDAHNGYLGTILELGFVGLLLFAILMLSLTRAAHVAMTRDFEWGMLGLIVVPSALVHNIAEQSLNGLNQRLMALMLVIVFTQASPHKQLDV